MSAIFVSRLSTALHAATTKVANTPSAIAVTDSLVELKDDRHHPSARLVITTLIVVALPVEIAFLASVVALGWIHLPFVFIALQILFFLFAVRALLLPYCSDFLGSDCSRPGQITISLLVANLLTTVLWKRGLDPDMYALPIQSALTDLTGQLLLVACYEVASLLGIKVALKHKHKNS